MWAKWHQNWRTLLAKSPGSESEEDSPRKVLRGLSKIRCDPEIAVRLAFLVASHKPATQSELAKDTRRQQRIKRKLSQSGQHLLDGARLLKEVASDFPLIFITPEHIDAARQTAQMCAHELEVLLEPRALELPSGHELYTLVAYLKASSGEPNYALVTDLLGFVYRANRQGGPDQRALERKVQRFARPVNRPDSIIPQLIEEHTFEWAKSGELKKDLLACFPGEIFPQKTLRS
jgi:hypothetical protein